MKKLLFMLIFALSLTFAACAKPPAETYDTIPTPPTIPAGKTPYDLLSAALEQTKSANAFTLEYRTNGEIVATQHFMAGESFQPAVELIQNPDFLADFCAMPLTAIPSNTGTIRYEVTGLTGAELSGLLGIELAAETECTVALEVDAEGFLTLWEYQAGADSGSITISHIET